MKQLAPKALPMEFDKDMQNRNWPTPDNIL